MELELELLNFLRMNCRKSLRRRQALRLRAEFSSGPPPSAERIVQRKDEQERRRREALASPIDLNMQSDVMTEFEETLSQPGQRIQEDQGDSNGNLCTTQELLDQ
nr:bromodomain testis-specific protein-like [Drosophila kikkawai]